jgi:hypothetical protein
MLRIRIVKAPIAAGTPRSANVAETRKNNPCPLHLSNIVFGGSRTMDGRPADVAGQELMDLQTFLGGTPRT